MNTEKIVKVKLLCNGGFSGMQGVKFPVIVDAVINKRGAAKVSVSELIRIGVSDTVFRINGFLHFSVNQYSIIKPAPKQLQLYTVKNESGL